MLQWGWGRQELVSESRGSHLLYPSSLFVLLCTLLCGVPRMAEFRLKPGDTMVFNNRRMLHGRSAFIASSPSSNRILHGCYINIDEFASRYQHLCRALDKHPWRGSVGNQAHDA